MTERVITYHCGLGGVSARVPPLPVACPGGFPLWWNRDERFWDKRKEQGFWRQPVPEA